MSRRHVIQMCSRALHHSQALGHVQLASLSCGAPAAATVAAPREQQQTPSMPQCSSSASSLHSSTRHSSSFPPHAARWQQQQQMLVSWPTLQTRAGFSTSQQARQSEEDLRVVQAEMSENDYHKLADETLDFLQERLEVFVEDMDIDGGDVEHAQGVLTVRLGSYGTYVINKQTPNRQIWLSSPVSGPFRYDYHRGRWVYHRDGRELLSQLQQELGMLLGSEPDLSD